MCIVRMLASNEKLFGQQDGLIYQREVRADDYLMQVKHFCCQSHLLPSIGCFYIPEMNLCVDQE